MTVDFKEIKDIIKTCAEYGVSRVKIGEIEVVFGENTQISPKIAKKPLKVKDNPTKRIEVEQEAIGQAEVKLKEDYIDNLLLEDPAEYERLAIQGELSDEETLDRGTEQTLQ
jgi:hypothetical protein